MKNSVKTKRSLRIRHKLKKVNKDRLRLSIYRSHKNIAAQIIDDKNNKTLIETSSFKKTSDKIKKADLSIKVAESLAKKAIEKKITKVYFDRGKYKYHGRVKIFAETLRKNGLIF
jgi:large subunit ribosomal protein L18